MGDGGRDLDAVAGRVAAELVAQSHGLPPGGAARLLAKVAAPLGVSAARVYLADLQQRNLRLMPPGSGTGLPEELPISSTTAGRAYRQVQLEVEPAEGANRRGRVWVPLLDGSERLGVLELIVRDAGEAMLGHYQTLASLTGLIIASKSIYSDTYARAMRSQEMALQGELVWAFTASRTFSTERLVVAAVLEPAYEVGGDAFDYALLGSRLHVSVFDAVGHDLTSGLLTSVAMAACRSTRRAGGALRDIATRADHAIAQQFGDYRFVTALLCELDVSSGRFTWIPCGHPPPLLIREGRVVRELMRDPQLPLGVADLVSTRSRSGGKTRPPVYTEKLQPGDGLLLYTDGVTEGRSADGTLFGIERLSDLLAQHHQSGLSASEMMRRLAHALTDYQRDRLSDDATMVLVRWLPGAAESVTAPQAASMWLRREPASQAGAGDVRA